MNDTGYVFKRRFTITKQHGGCINDVGYLMVLDYGTVTGCPSDSYGSYPYFLYSSSQTYERFKGMYLYT